jgi:hypothetical protein
VPKASKSKRPELIKQPYFGGAFFMPNRAQTKPIDANYLTNGEGLKNAIKSK